MKQELSVLMLEDVATDAESVELELNKSGLDCHFQWSKVGNEFFARLRENPPDVILSDNDAVSFDSLTMLDLVHDRLPRVPFIFLANSMSCEATERALRHGAAGCILKQQLSNLAPTIRRALIANGAYSRAE